MRANLRSYRMAARFTIVLLWVLYATTAAAWGSIDPGRLNAFYVRRIPRSYPDQERLLGSLQDCGASAAIIDLPVSEDGLPDATQLPNMVYLIHKAGLQVFVVVPVRRLPGVLRVHPDWEDERYDLVERATSGSGMLDIFKTDVVLYLTEITKSVAAFSVDGILYGQDFMLGPGDAMSDWAIERAEKQLGERVRPKTLFMKAKHSEFGTSGSFAPLFWRWEEIKRDRLLQVYDAMAAAGRAVRGSLRFGIPAHVVLPVYNQKEMFAKYAYDMGKFKERAIDYYWTWIDLSDRTHWQGPSYRQAMEIISRTATSTASSVNDLERRSIVLNGTTADGRMRPLSELEESTELVRNSGPSGIVFTVMDDTSPPKEFMHKIFGNSR